MSSGGGGTNTTTTQSGPPPQFLQAYQNINNQAANVAGQPLQQYGGNIVAGLSPDQQAGISGIQNAQGAANPFINAAAQEIGNSTTPLTPALQPYANQAQGLFGQAGGTNLTGTAQPGVTAAEQLFGAIPQGVGDFANSASKTFNSLPGTVQPAVGAANQLYGALPQAVGGFVNNASRSFNSMPGAVQPGVSAADMLYGASASRLNPTQFSAGQVGQYESPYTQQVVNATQGEFANQNAQQNQGIVGNSISNGAFGGDRTGVAQGIAAGQEQLAQAPVIAGLENQGYAQALQEFNTQQQTGLAAQQATQQLEQGAGAGILAGGQQKLSALGQSGQGNLAAGQAYGSALGTAGAGILSGGQESLAAAQARGQGNLAAGQAYGSALGAAGQGILGASGQLVGAAQGQGQLQLGAGQGVAGVGGQMLGASQAQDWLASQAGFGMANLGNEAQNTALTGANAQLGVGGLEQQVAQEQLNVPYEQFLQQQAYPFQTTGFQANIAEGLGGASGGSSSTRTPGPSAVSQAAGLGLTGAGIYNLLGFGGGAVDAGPWNVAARGGAIPGRASGGPIGIPTGVPDLSVSVVPGAQGMGVPPSQSGSSSLLNSGTGSTSTTKGGGGGGGLLNDILPIAAIGAHFLSDGGPVPERAMGGIMSFPSHRTRMPGTGSGITTNDNMMPHIHVPKLAVGGVNIPQLPTGGGSGIVGGNGVSIPQLPIGGRGAPATGGGMNAVNAYLAANHGGQPPRPASAGGSGIVAPPPPAAAPPTSLLGTPGQPMTADQQAAQLAANFGPSFANSPAMGGGGGSGGNARGGSIGRDAGGATRPGDPEGFDDLSLADAEGPLRMEGLVTGHAPVRPPLGVPGEGPPPILGDPMDTGMPMTPPRVPSGTMLPPPAGLDRNGASPQPVGPVPPPPQSRGIMAGNLPPPPPPPAQQQEGAGIIPTPGGPVGGNDVMGQPGGAQAGMAGGEDPQTRRPDHDRSHVGETLLMAGLGILGGSSPFPGVNIGRGGAQGLQFAEQMRLRDEQADMRRYQQEEAADYHRMLGMSAQQRAATGEQNANTNVVKAEGSNAANMARAAYLTQRTNNPHATQGDMLAAASQSMQQQVNPDTGKPFTAAEAYTHLKGIDIQQQNADTKLNSSITSAAQRQQAMADHQAAQAFREKAFAMTHDQHVIDAIRRTSDHDAGLATSLMNQNPALADKPLEAMAQIQKMHGAQAPAAGGGSEALPMPPPAAAEAVVGKTYNTQRGPAKWDGQQFIPVQ